jgi:hypothetical protein
VSRGRRVVTADTVGDAGAEDRTGPGCWTATC